MSQETQDDPQDAAPILSAEDILALYRPEEKPIEIVLPGGGKLTFKPIASTKDRRDLQQRIIGFMNTIPSVETPGHKGFPNIDVMPKDNEDVFTSLLIHFRSLTPHISMRTAFEFHKAPDLIDHIERQLGIADRSLFEIQRQKAIEAAQKKSRTPGSVDGSPSVSAPSQEETPTT